jgi:hypothetical protein
VAAQLGHANPELTLRVYAHALREEEADLSFLDFDRDSNPRPSAWEARWGSFQVCSPVYQNIHRARG